MNKCFKKRYKSVSVNCFKYGVTEIYRNAEIIVDRHVGRIIFGFISAESWIRDANERREKERIGVILQ